MTLDETTLEGTLKADGSLELDQKPSLAPGRVVVTLRQLADPAPPPKENLWQFMQRTRRELEASGRPFMNEQEVNAHIEWLREGDHIDELLRRADEALGPVEPQ
jgi:hypothetical protein